MSKKPVLIPRSASLDDQKRSFQSVGPAINAAVSNGLAGSATAAEIAFLQSEIDALQAQINALKIPSGSTASSSNLGFAWFVS